MPDDSADFAHLADARPSEVIVIPEATSDETLPAVLARPWAGRSPHVSSPARRRALMPWALGTGVLVLVGAGAVGLTYTPVFHAKSITVSGERRLSEQRILKIAGIGPGTDVFHLNLAGVEGRLEQNPWIANAVVSKHLPSTLSVVISERRPVALGRSTEGAKVYLALDGTVLAPAPGNPMLPEVRIAPGAPATPAALATGAVVAKGLPAALLSEVATITVDAQGSVVLQMRSGVTATYGDGSDAQLKGEALKAVLDYAPREGSALISVDVEVPGAPTAVFADSAVATVPPSP